MMKKRSYQAVKENIMKNFAENLQEQVRAKYVREANIQADRAGRRQRVKESLLHPLKDPEGKYNRIKRLFKYSSIGAGVGGLIGSATKHGKIHGAATGGAIGLSAAHLVNQLPYARKEIPHVAGHLGGVTGGTAGKAKRAFQKGYHED